MFFIDFTIENAVMTENEKTLVTHSVRKVWEDRAGNAQLYAWVTHIQDNVLNILNITEPLYIEAEAQIHKGVQ